MGPPSWPVDTARRALLAVASAHALGNVLDRITEEAREADLAVVVRDDDGARTTYRTTVSAEVER
ncbi:hypothetical protein BRD03_07875 [Halobacteriales archaeon QS_9_68_17]|nr:MAG: hypothetical protein BRD03_07875 [Halobacteriales archaeon QS_9_68_17]